MNKLDLFEPLVADIVRASGQPESDVRQIVSNMTWSELVGSYDFQVKQGKIKPFLNQAQTDALKALAHAEKAQDEVLLAQAQAAAQKTVFQLKQFEEQAPARAEQLRADREVFEDGAKTLGYSITDANFNIARSLLGPGLTIWKLQQAFDSGALQGMTAATHEEEQQWHQERVQAEQKYLKSLDILSLRKIVREQGRRPAPQQLDETQRVREAEQRLNEPIFETLTAGVTQFQGQKITKSMLIKLPPQQLRIVVQRFGGAQVTAVLHGTV